MEGLKENLSTEDLLEIISNLNKKLDFLIETMSIPKENFTREEACQYLTMGRTTFDKEVESGRIRFKTKGDGEKNKQRIFRKVWLNDWMERYTWNY